MPFTTWIRDPLGIHKDVIDIKKSKLETERLEDEKRARNLITPATMDDVEKYDNMYARIRRELERDFDKSRTRKGRIADKSGPGCLIATMQIILVLLSVIHLVWFSIYQTHQLT
jgi:hypothetical protein